MFYSISYFNMQGEFKYVDRQTFQEVTKALIRATLHLSLFNTEVQYAKVIYQGQKVHKVVREIKLRNPEPKYQ